jgi:hypothetical protein
MMSAKTRRRKEKRPFVSEAEKQALAETRSRREKNVGGQKSYSSPILSTGKATDPDVEASVRIEVGCLAALSRSLRLCAKTLFGSSIVFCCSLRAFASSRSSSEG